MSWRMAARGALAVIEYPLLDLPGIRHGYVVKPGGRDIDEQDVYRELGRERRLAVTHQTHGDRVAAVDGAFTGHWPRKVAADGLMTDVPGTVITIHTADCVPLLLAAERAVMLVHAGWRGTAAGIASKAVASFCERYHLAAADIRAVVGPAIEQRCYPVGDEVAGRFADDLSAAAAGNARTLDLKEANRRQLVAAGLAKHLICVSPHCTRCDAGLFHSYRREGSLRGTMIAFMEVSDVET